MSRIKLVLSLLTIVVAYGVVGTMDYEDAVMMENAYRQPAPADRFDSTCDSSALAIHDGQVRNADVAGERTGVTACASDSDQGIRHVHRN